MKRHSTFMGYSKQGASDSALFIDLNSTFKKKHSNHICFIENENDSNNDDQSGESDGKGGNQGANTGAITLTQEQFEQLLNRANGKAKDEDENFFDKRDKENQRKKDDEKQSKATQQQISDATKFNLGFADTFKSNSALFPETARTAIDDAKKEHPDDVVKQANLAQAIAARDFFKSESNLKLLDSNDRAFVEANVIKPRNDEGVNGPDAWKLVERALFNYSISSRNQQQRSAGAGGQTGYKTLDTKLAGFFGEHVKDAKGV